MSSAQTVPPGHEGHNPGQSSFEGPMAATYNRRTGGCNIRLARSMISLALPHLPTEESSNELNILDNACGPLVLTKSLISDLTMLSLGPKTPIHIDAVDLSASFISANKTDLTTLSLPPNITVTTDEMDSQSLSFPSNHFRLSFASLVIFALPSPVKGVQEIYRTLAPNGVALVTSWKAVGWTKLLHHAEKRMGKSPTRFSFLEPWMKPNKLRDTLIEGGFAEENVREETETAMAWWGDEEDFAGSLAETLRMMVGNAWSEGEKEQMKDGLLKSVREGKAEDTGVLYEKNEEGVVKRVGVNSTVWVGIAVKK